MFRSRARLAVVDNDWKLLSFPSDRRKGRRFELYNLAEDKAEAKNLISSKKEVAELLRNKLQVARLSIEASVNGEDYPDGKLNPQPPRIFWTEVKDYRPYLKDWKNRPEYQSRLKRF